MEHSAGKVVEIWRYAVSSVSGERLHTVALGHHGVFGDRQYGLIDAVTSQPAAPEKHIRWRKSLYLQATKPDGGPPSVHFPNGPSCSVLDPALNGLLSDYFGFAVAVAALERTRQNAMLPLAQHRHPHFAVHLLTTASLRRLAQLRQVNAIDPRRFRPTVLVEVEEPAAFIENGWVGRRLRLGDALLSACEQTQRCGVTFIGQPGLEEDPEILRTILRHNKRHLGVYCSVELPGELRIGDKLFLQEPIQAP